MAKALSSMNKAELYAEAQRLRGNAGSKSGPKKVWTNIAGHACGSEFTMNRSNSKIERHVKGLCGCDSSAGFRCASVKWANSPFTYANRGIGLTKARKVNLIS